ncbi:MAG: SAM-dependent methyltransferase [Candidatus Azotimanducaceae bacterium]|jgi:SAM-dependent methyltransferase
MSDQPGNRWDERYQGTDYLFGTEPNDFLATAVQGLVPAETLCLADGEGRNGVFLAGLGHRVTSLDASTVGLEKAQLLASQHDVSIKTRLADLTTEDLGHETWDLIVSIFFHLPTAERHALHQRIARALRPGGRIILEAYTPAQLAFKTGGPSRPEMLMSLPLLRADFAGLAVVHAIELERDVVEGAGHIGRSAVVQFVADKPIQ